MKVTYKTQKLHFIKGKVVEKTTFSNGAVFLSCHTPQLYAASAQIHFLAGSCFEKEDEQGLAHLLEHMFFKGEISSMESLCGEFASKEKLLERIEEDAEINAATGKELVSFDLLTLGHKLTKIFPKFLSLVGDLQFSNEDLNKEKNVISQEIREDNEDYELYGEEKLFEKCFPFPLGHSIGGSLQSLKQIDKKKLLKFYRKFFKPNRMVISVTGNLESKKLIHCLLQFFEVWSRGNKLMNPWRPKINKRLGELKVFKQTYYRKWDVSCILIGGTGFSVYDPRHLDLIFILYYLVQGMSSVLFQKLRIELGAVYALEAYPNSFSTNGNFVISAVTTPPNMEIVEDEIKRALEVVASEGVPTINLEKTRRQIIDDIEFSFDNAAEINGYLSDMEITYSEVKSFKQLKEELNAVSNESTRIVMKMIWEKGLSIVKIRPAKKKR